MSEYFCDDCGDSCYRKRESFDYAGSHCTNGSSGTHYTDDYSSSCCGATMKDNYEETDYYIEQQ